MDRGANMKQNVYCLLKMGYIIWIKSNTKNFSLDAYFNNFLSRFRKRDILTVPWTDKLVVKSKKAWNIIFVLN